LAKGRRQKHELLPPEGTGRAKKNKIRLLRKEDGQIMKDKAEMEGMAHEFFRQLYSADQGVRPSELTQLFEPKISDDANAALCKEFTDEEISDALFQIGPLKAPGPDGFPAHFFQRNWNILKADVIKGVKEFFVSGHMPPVINETSIVLIPKKNDPEFLKDYRPISLCNVIYKVILKCLVNRLRPLLQDIIDPTQSAFIPRRLITDNTLIAFECLHAIKNGNMGCRKFGAYKLDLTKAYDRVEWGFLEGVLKRLGFHSTWIHWVMECVTSVSYSIRFKNVSLEPFKPSRGLRQGDPLSPYLFLFIADGLSKLLQGEIQQGNLHELKICRRASGVSHLLFADNTMLFMEISEAQADRVNQVLREYEKGTGQLINPAKCSIMFGSGCSEENKEKVKGILKVENVAQEEKY
jgi:hypothetical protein